MCRFHHQALVELKILDVIKRKDKDNLHNVIHMKEYFYFRNHLCISFELLGSVHNKQADIFMCILHMLCVTLSVNAVIYLKPLLPPLWFQGNI